MSSLSPCVRCGAHVRTGAECPHCASTPRAPLVVAAALLALTGAGCDSLPKPEPAYGIMESGMSVDEDGDGYTADVDCDDADDTVHPDATETAGDGVDSNCNDDDDT